MHLITNNFEIDMGGFGRLTPGSWIATDQNAFEIALHAERGSVKLEPINWDVAGEPKNVLIIANGAKGDLLFLTPVLRDIRARLKDVKVTLACFPVHHSLFVGTDLFDGLINYPVNHQDAVDFDRIVSLENVLELSRGVHATVALARALESDGLMDFKPAYVALPEETAWAATTYPRTDRPRLGIQMVASVANRNYPMEQWTLVINGLIRRGWEVFVLGHPGQFPKLRHQPDKLRNLTIDNLTFRKSAAVLQSCDAFCGVDSAWLHMCHALDVPAVGLYGPFPWEERTSKAPLTRTLSGTGECAPCYWHIHAGRHFPPNKPCSEKGVCVVLASIPPERIIAKVDQLRPQ